MAGEEPPYLTVGTDVSAKYKGAFCEAKIKKVTRSVKCKLTFKNNVGVAMVTDDQVRGTLRVGAHVEAKHPDKNQYLEAVINKLNDCSQYTVVFDDGDETTLRRTSLCLKSGRHFAESETLDQLPLTHPEHFGNPVMNAKGRRSRNATRSPAVDESSDDEQSPKKKEPKLKPTDPDIGKVVTVEQPDKKKVKENWFPALIVSPKCQDSIRVKKQEEYLVRSFRDGKYYVITKKDSKEFNRETTPKPDNNSLKNAVEKVLTYLDKDDLPNHWDRDVLFGLEDSSNEESDQASDSDTSDDEPSEEKDRFVAQLYKFMDDRGTPINKAPCVSNRDLNLYKLFKVVQKIGGYNRATNQMQWKSVYAKMGFPPGNSAHMKLAYKKYLHSFEEFYRKLGISMGSSTRSGRVRYRSGRYLLLARDQHFKETKRRSKQDQKSAASDKAEKEKVKPRDEVEVKTEPEETSSEKQEKESPAVNVTEKKIEVATQESKEKINNSEDEDDDDSKADREDSDAETTPSNKDETKSKAKLKKEDAGPKRRGRKKIEKPPSADDDNSSNNNEDEDDDYRDALNIAIGDRIKVKYGRGRQQKIYEAKVLKLGEDENEKEFFVHYTGWNMRYDEWVKRHRIVKNLSQKGLGRRPRSTTPAKNAKTSAKKGRPQSGGGVSAKENPSDRKSVTPTSCSSLRSRGGRSDKPSNESPTVDQKRLTRHSSLQRDMSEDSESDSTENPKKLKRSSSKKAAVEESDTSVEIKAEDEPEEVASVKDAEETGKKTLIKSVEKDTPKKDPVTEKTTKEKPEIPILEEEDDSKKQAKKSKERPKAEDSPEQLEDSPKTTRRPRGRPPRQSGEDKKTPSTSVKSPISETKDDLESTDCESQVHSNDGEDVLSEQLVSATILTNVKNEDEVISNTLKDSVKVDFTIHDHTFSKSEKTIDNDGDKDEDDDKNEDERMEDSSTTELENVNINEILNKDDEQDPDTEESPETAEPSPSCDESKMNLLCDEQMTEELNDDDNEIVDVPRVNQEVNNAQATSPAQQSELKEPDCGRATADLEVAIDESLKDELQIAEAVDKISEDVSEQVPSSAAVDKFDLLRLESCSRDSERFIKKEVADISESAFGDVSIGEKVSPIKSSELDVYEYAEESAAEKVNLKENVPNKSDRASQEESAQVCAATDSSVVSNEIVNAFKEGEQVEEMMIKTKGMVNLQGFSTPVSTATLSIVETHSEQSEKWDQKLDTSIISSSGSSVVPHSSSSSKGMKKDKKRKNHKSEKRKLLLEGDTSEDGSGIDDPKTKKKKNRDEEFGGKKESKGKEQKTKKSRDKKNKSKSDRDELKLLKKKVSLEKSRRKECKKKKETQEKSRKDKDEDSKILDSDEISSLSSDSCQKKDKKKSKKHQHRCEKNREDSEKKRAKKYKATHDDGATSDESNRGSKKNKREEKSRSKKKRDKSKPKEFPISSEDSNSSKTNVPQPPLPPPLPAKLKEKSGEKLEKNLKEDVECDMSKYLMCEEKVPASPVGMIDIPETSSSQEDKSDKSSGFGKDKENVRNKTTTNLNCDAATSSFSVFSLHNRHLKLDVTDPPTVIDNTPPTTPESSSTTTLVSEPMNNEQGSPSYMSPNDTDSNQLVITGSKSSQSSSLNDYSDEADRCQDLLIDDSDNRAETIPGSDDGVREDNAKSTNLFRGTSLKRPNPDHDDQTIPKKRKKRHRKRSASVSEGVKPGSSVDGGTKQGNKHSKGAETDELPSSTSETSLLASASGLLMGRLNPTANFTDPSAFPQPTRPSRFNFYVELDDYADGDQRIAVIQEKLTELRRTYMALKAEVACIDRRRKKLRKKEKEAAASSSTTVATSVVECN